MNPLLRQRLHVIFFTFGGIFLFAGVAFLALPAYTMASWEKVQADHAGTVYTDDMVTYRVYYTTPLQRYTFTLKDGKQKFLTIPSKEASETKTLYFHHTQTSAEAMNV